MLCPSCSSVLADGSTACAYCGARIHEVPPNRDSAPYLVWRGPFGTRTQTRLGFRVSVVMLVVVLVFMMVVFFLAEAPQAALILGPIIAFGFYLEWLYGRQGA